MALARALALVLELAMALALARALALAWAGSPGLVAAAAVAAAGRRAPAMAPVVAAEQAKALTARPLDRCRTRRKSQSCTKSWFPPRTPRSKGGRVPAQASALGLG